MAAQEEIDEKVDITVDNVMTPENTLSLDEESKLLLNHKCVYNLGKNNCDLTFYPSPHL